MQFVIVESGMNSFCRGCCAILSLRQVLIILPGQLTSFGHLESFAANSSAPVFCAHVAPVTPPLATTLYTLVSNSHQGLVTLDNC